jgi:hypothetical protein
MGVPEIVLAVLVTVIVLVLVFGAFQLLRREPATKLPAPRAWPEAQAALARAEYTLALIKAFTAVETGLRTKYSKPGEQIEVYLLIGKAVNAGRFDKNDEQLAHQLRMQRNKVVHEGANVHQPQAEQAVASAKQLLRDLNFEL